MKTPDSKPDLTWHSTHYFERGKHENELTNHRLTWLLASQTLLFAGYGVVLTSTLAPKTKAELGQVAEMLGLCSALLIWLGIVASVFATIRLWQESNVELRGNNLPLQIKWWTTWLGWSPPLLLPVLFGVAWFWLARIGVS
jgi:hypothetical protein